MPDSLAQKVSERRIKVPLINPFRLYQTQVEPATEPRLATQRRCFPSFLYVFSLRCQFWYSSRLPDRLAPPLPPQQCSVHHRVNAPPLPPLSLIAHGMEGTVVGGAEGHGPFVTHLAAHGPRDNRL